MAFPQSTIAYQQAAGVPGELAYEGPRRAFPWTLQGGGVPHVIGATAYTVVSEGIAGGTGIVSGGIAMPGGTGEFAGILVNPKAYANFGGNQGGISPTMTLPDDTVGELLIMGFPFVTLTTAANIGDAVFFSQATGALSSQPVNTTYIGSIAGTTLTVTGTPVGKLAVGSVVAGAGVAPGTTITALGTGTGGAGTYTVNNTQTVASGNLSSPAVAAAGTTQMPRAKVILRQVAAGGLAILELTN